MDSRRGRWFDLLNEYFEHALEIADGPDRDAYVKEVCAGDSELEAELRRLLEADATVRMRSSAKPGALPRFGAYQARELIGRGGMAVVYRASREDGEVRQEVAIKVMRSVIWPEEAEQRFRRERQILAALNHRNIARFLDVGVTKDGVPYLVMEFIEGEHIDRWCDRARVPVRERLQLFLKVCDAVSFAHQKLVVHRDLKPSNILVTADGEPKLLDFGIARTLDAETDENPTRTAAAFTPQYASPEQLRGEVTGVASDVYSLGAVLFELLTGKPVFGGSGKTPANVIAEVLTREPGLPSESVPDSNEPAAARGLDSPGTLRRRLKGDLDAIVNRAVAKTAAGRYASVEQLADDVHRYLDGFPVRAASTGGLYRAGKFLGRHRKATGTAALVAFSLIAGLGATLWQARLAREQRAAAERRFDIARGLAHYMIFDVQFALEKLPSSTPLRAQMIDQSLAYLDRLSADKTSSDDLRVDIGYGYYALADALGAPWRPNLGQIAKAMDAYRKAIAILEPVAAHDPNNRRAVLYLNLSKAWLGQCLGFGRESAGGRKLQEEAAQQALMLSQRWPADFEIRERSGAIWYFWARTLMAGTGYFATAENAGPALDAGRHAIENYEAALHLRPGDLNTIRQLVNCFDLLGYITDTRDSAQATSFFRQAVTMLDRMRQPDRPSTVARQTRSNALLALGTNLGRLGNYAEGIAMVDEARRIRDQLAEEDSSDRTARLTRYITHERLAELQESAGQTVPALAGYLRTVKILDELLAENPSNRNLQLTRADAEVKAARLCARFGRSAEAERMSSAALAFYKEAAAQPNAGAVELTLAAQVLMESPVARLRDPKLAFEYMQRASRKAGNDQQVQESLGEAYWLNGDRAHAVQSIERALSLIPPALTPQRKALLDTLKKYQSEKLR